MSRNRTTYIVTSGQEDGSVGPPSPPIPSTGYPTSVVDVYRVQDLHENGFIGTNACFTDLQTCQALARVIEGEVTHFKQIEAAETALQILLFHDCVDVLVPSVKVKNDQFLFYSRNTEQRSALAFQLFQPCDPHDHLVSQEFLRAEKEVVTGSTLKDSKLVGTTLPKIKSSQYTSASWQSACYPSLCGLFEVPGYFSDPDIEEFFDNRGFLHRFYESVSVPWKSHMSSTPTTSLTISLPPLLAVVLGRSVGREKIPEAIKELRENLEDVRKELQGFNLSINSSSSEAEAQAEIKRLSAVFSSTVPAALQTNIERRQRKVADIFTIAGALKAPFAHLAKLLNPNYEQRDVARLVNKTITSKTFARLLDIEPVGQLCESFFTKPELRSIHKSYKTEVD